MHKFIKKMRDAIQVVLLAPVKLPGKVLSILKYVAVGLGIVEAVLEQETDDPVQTDGEEVSHETVE